MQPISQSTAQPLSTTQSTDSWNPVAQQAQSKPTQSSWGAMSQAIAPTSTPAATQPIQPTQSSWGAMSQPIAPVSTPAAAQPKQPTQSSWGALTQPIAPTSTPAAAQPIQPTQSSWGAMTQSTESGSTSSPWTAILASSINQVPSQSSWGAVIQPQQQAAAQTNTWPQSTQEGSADAPSWLLQSLQSHVNVPAQSTALPQPASWQPSNTPATTASQQAPPLNFHDIFG